MIIGAEPVDQPHDGPHNGHHGGDAQPHVRREGINEEGVLGEVAGPPVHEGVGLHVNGLGEVDDGHPCVVHGEGGGGEEDLFVHHLADHSVPPAETILNRSQWLL